MPIIYKLRPSDRAPALRSRTLLVMGVIAVMFIAWLIAVALQARITWSNLLQLGVLSALLSSAWSTLFAFALTTALLVFGVRESIKSIWKSFEIELGNDYVSRRQVRSTEIRVGKSEVKYSQEDSNGLTVITDAKNKLLRVPRTLDGYDAVKSALASWAPSRTPLPESRMRMIAASIVVLVGMVIVLFSFDVWLLMVANIGLLGYSGFTYLKIRGNEGVDPQLKRGILFIIGWVLFFDLVKICLYLSFMMPVK
jgi:hypothetical protein